MGHVSGVGDELAAVSGLSPQGAKALGQSGRNGTLQPWCNLGPVGTLCGGRETAPPGVRGSSGRIRPGRIWSRSLREEPWSDSDAARPVQGSQEPNSGVYRHPVEVSGSGKLRPDVDRLLNEVPGFLVPAEQHQNQTKVLLGGCVTKFAPAVFGHLSLEQ